MAVVGPMFNGRVAQLGSALLWLRRGPEFKSRLVHHVMFFFDSFSFRKYFSQSLEIFFLIFFQIFICSFFYKTTSYTKVKLSIFRINNVQMYNISHFFYDLRHYIIQYFFKRTNNKPNA